MEIAQYFTLTGLLIFYQQDSSFYTNSFNVPTYNTK